MPERQCVCGKCAESEGHISLVTPEVEEVYILHTITIASEKMGLSPGDQCEVDHDHAKSKSCSFQYYCPTCTDVHKYYSDAEACCPQWVCNFCGWIHHDGYYTGAKELAASCCAHYCGECNAYGWPDFLDDHDCVPHDEDGMGLLHSTLPWEERGIKVSGHDPNEGRNWQTVWGFNPEELDVVQAAADYYLLEAMKAGLVGTTNGQGEMVLPGLNLSTTFRLVLNEANEMFNALVQKWDPILQAYTHMACGGELRHHRAVGGNVLNGDRDVAWSGWKMIYDAVGPDALQDAATLFLEFGGGSFGGEPWANACRILHARVTNQINPALFLDRIFNAQHNGGCLLNKVNWQGEATRYTTGKYKWALTEMQSRVLPAHGAEPEPDYPTLLAYASPEVRLLFSDCFEYAGHAAKEYGLRLSQRAPKPKVGFTHQTEYEYRQAKLSAQQAAYNAMSMSQKLAVDLRKIRKDIAVYVPLAKSEATSNARKRAQIKANGPNACECGQPECSMPWKQTYYTETLEIWQAKAATLAAQILQWQAYEEGIGPEPTGKLHKPYVKLAPGPW